MLTAQGINFQTATPQQLALDQPNIFAVITRLRALETGGALLRFGHETDALDPIELIRSGRVAIWPSEFSGGLGQPGDPDFAVGTVPYPVGMPDLSGDGADGYIISAGTAHPNAAWRWIEFLSHQPIARGRSAIGIIPARRSLAAQLDTWNRLDADSRAAYEWAIAHPAQKNGTKYPLLDALLGGLSQLAAGQTQEQVLAEAQRRWQQTEAVPLAVQPTPDTSPILVAPPITEVAPAGATTITFAAIGSDAMDMRRLARVFTEQYPDISVQITTPGPFTSSPQIADIARSSDCFSWWGAPTTAADREALLDLQPLLDADATVPQSDYPTTILEPYQHAGGLFGLPYAVTLPALAYNRTAFDAARIPTPIAQWKPDDFLATALQLTTGDGASKQYGYVPLRGIERDLLFFLGQFGVQLTQRIGESIRPNFNDPQVLAGVQWYLDLARVHHVMPPLGTGESAESLVRAGRVGMWFDDGQLIVSLQQGSVANGKTSFEVERAPLPIGASGLNSGDLTFRGLHIAAHTQQAQACWSWLTFLSSDTTNLFDSIPARSSVAQTEAFALTAPTDVVQLYHDYGDVLQHATTDDASSGEQVNLYWFFQAVRTAGMGNGDLALALDSAQQQTTTFMECVEKTVANQPPSACVQQADPSYQGP